MHLFFYAKNQAMRQGFSLVELSIVLVILGLLVGGILAGQSLIRASQLRGIGEAYRQFQTATYTFRDKYFALPGDFTQATAIWGAQDGNDGIGSDCYESPSSDQKTCNGDGDGTLQDSSGVSSEKVRYWQHLANAGLIAGQYTGASDGAAGTDAAQHETPGVNTPLLRVDNANFGPEYRSGTGNVNEYQHAAGHVYLLGTDISISGNSPSRPIISTVEAWNLDTKLDNGLPASGKITSIKYGATSSYAVDAANCATATDDTAQYALSNTSSQACTLYFWW